MKYLALGGGMSQMDAKMSEYLEAIKLCYKDLVSVAKDQESN